MLCRSLAVRADGRPVIRMDFDAILRRLAQMGTIVSTDRRPLDATLRSQQPQMKVVTPTTRDWGQLKGMGQHPSRPSTRVSSVGM